VRRVTKSEEEENWIDWQTYCQIQNVGNRIKDWHDKPLSIELFKETLPWALTFQLMKLEMPLKTIDDWYEWAATLNHKHHKLTWAIKQTRGTLGNKKAPQQKYYLPWKECDPNAMDINRLTVNECNKLLKEGRCFRCRNTGHRANKCPDDNNDKTKAKEVPKKKMNRRELHAHVQALFKEMTEKDRDEFQKASKKQVFKKESCLDVSISLSWCILCNHSQHFLEFDLSSYNIGLSKKTVETVINSGTGRLFIDQNFAKNFEINYLHKPVKAYNVDGTENKQGMINAYVNLEFKLGDQKFNKRFYVTGLGKQRIIFGFPWLHNTTW
jgi:hypothetical protein